MSNTITSCQANQLLSLQRDLMETGLIVSITEATPCATTDTTTPHVTRKTAKRRGRPRKVDTVPTATTTTKTRKSSSRKMSKAGRGAIASASVAYHAEIRRLRADAGLTQKQARARYKKEKAV